jgi:teichoic acid transport system permease protein
VPDFLDFLVIGVFVFNFTQRSFIISSRVMFDSLPLIRALHFPRACLPLGYVLIELQQLVISFVVLFIIVLATPGESLSVYWLLIIPVLVMQTLFNVGAAFILARFGAGFDDVSQLLPFIVRTWFYASGVMFSIQTYSNLAKHPTLAKVLEYNPAAIYITLIRDALLKTQRQSTPGAKPYNPVKCYLYYHPPRNAPGSYLSYSGYCHTVVSQANLWLAGAAWAVVILIAGFLFFWRAEVQYGRG